ncbi:MAG: hypothetical protein NXI30_13455 [bacterium]|nr:hypothetical protein [bacterium]
MRALFSFPFLVALIVIGLASTPAAAVTPTPGDIFTNSGSALLHWDTETDVTTIVSCWSTAQCDSIIGSGPIDPAFALLGDVKVGPNGLVHVVWSGDAFPNGVMRIDPETGDRELTGATIPVLDQFEVYPAPGALFAPTVAGLGTTGLALLVVGVLLGMNLRLRTTPRVAGMGRGRTLA